MANNKIDNEDQNESFRGNPRLRPENFNHDYTPEEIDEMKKCMGNWKYFAENYHHIIDGERGLAKIKTRPYQDTMINNFVNNRFNIVLASRQCINKDSIIKIKNKNNGKIEEISIEEFYLRFKNNLPELT